MASNKYILMSFAKAFAFLATVVLVLTGIQGTLRLTSAQSDLAVLAAPFFALIVLTMAATILNWTKLLTSIKSLFKKNPGNSGKADDIK